MQGVTPVSLRAWLSKVDGLFPAKVSIDEFFNAFYFHLVYFMAYLEGRRRQNTDFLDHILKEWRIFNYILW